MKRTILLLALLLWPLPAMTAADAQVIADIHTLDQVHLNARPYNRRGHYPGPARWPLALVREYGKYPLRLEEMDEEV